MTFDDIKRLLAMAAARDNRTPSQAMALAWNQDLGDLEYDECVEGMNRHYRSADPIWITPQHIRGHVREVRDEKRRGTSAPLQLPGPWVPDEDRAARNARGAELCRQAAAEAIAAAEQRRWGTDVDPIREKALQRARQEKRERQGDKASNPQMPGLVRQATKHMQHAERTETACQP